MSSNTRQNPPQKSSYFELPELFYSRQLPTPVRQPAMVIFNHALADELGLTLGLEIPGDDSDDSAAWTGILAGNRLLPGAEPISLAYAGHQFGHSTILGDGRAILLGEQIAPDGRRWDLQLKGSGTTPYSRNGDGRAALGPMLREYLISEAMHALGVPTSRALAVVTTGETVQRERRLPGAVLTRIASSHIRIGTFEYAARVGQAEDLKRLADYTIRRHYPQLSEAESPYLALFDAISDATASLVAQWMLIGFIHGVMNSDNCAVSGESIDYGPCAFMDNYHPATLFSSIDIQGRYAYGNQPQMALWNLARLAETLLPLLLSGGTEEQSIDIAKERLERFPELYRRYWLDGMRAKLGLIEARPEDEELAQELLHSLRRLRADYTNTLRALSSPELPAEHPFGEELFLSWHARWQERLQQEKESATPEERRALMDRSNPAVIPRNHRVEAALRAAEDEGDYEPFRQLHRILSNPYREPEGEERIYRLPPMESERVVATFCGT